MYYHLILTDACNLCCSYCRAKDFEESDPFGRWIAFDEDVPPELSFDLRDLYRFLSQDSGAVLTFYGGEPLLRLDLVREVMDHAPIGRFMLQTNALLLDRLEPEYRNRFSTVLVSIDGPEVLTDAHRGKGVYRRVMENVHALLDGGYTGELIARMTITEKTDIEKAVLYLSENSDHSFSSIHWQIDADFWGDYSKRDFGRWAAGSYNPGIRRLVGHWVERMKEGTVPTWYPFLGVTADLLLGREGGLRCGCGYANYTVMTDGTIIPCPCMVGMRDWYLGNVATTRPQDLPEVSVEGPCTACDLIDFCGGRCLYSSILRPWPEVGRHMVCGTVRNLRDAVVSSLPEIRELIREGVVSLDDFAYERYNGCEIIP
ncbi:TIGR04084 family radical SAM/SPASM domain-containing protein [Methanofollis aquaemaris]|uniref:TIGR04084 family radical SAM/SPASM domain-containing protein n=2 Tax=Methanofollis aquaemaris TaxID=126734 RepID=A0A8A3SA40_9EURY|nr:TIGR04084 family radical SAM/SPASM domain-containing protein [Methanofollis aquaemaris]